MIRLRETSRGFAAGTLGSKWVARLVLLYMGLLVLISVLARYTPLSIKTCMFRNMTDKPCGGCGSTRIMFSVLEGKPVEAFLLNPFMFLFLFSAVNLLLLKVLFKRKIEFKPPRPIWWTLGAALLAAYMANWWYIWHHVG